MTTLEEGVKYIIGDLEKYWRGWREVPFHDDDDDVYLIKITCGLQNLLYMRI
jgi:hypothetical protein